MNFSNRLISLQFCRKVTKKIETFLSLAKDHSCSNISQKYKEKGLNPTQNFVLAIPILPLVHFTNRFCLRGAIQT